MLAFRYRLAGQIRSGGVVELHAATDERTGSGVWLKLVRPARAGALGPAAAMRLAAEAESLQQIEHPGVPRILADGWDEPTGARFVVIEPAEGEGLDARLSRDGRLDDADAVRILEALCGTLGAIHGGRLVHLNLSPSAVFLPSGADAYPVLLLDLWLRRVGDRVDPPGPLDAETEYWAPELARGGVADERADIYALGTLMRRMLRDPGGQGTGRDADRSASALRALVSRCMSANPTDRPAHTGDVVEALRSIRAAAAPAGATA